MTKRSFWPSSLNSEAWRSGWSTLQSIAFCLLPQDCASSLDNTQQLTISPWKAKFTVIVAMLDILGNVFGRKKDKNSQPSTPGSPSSTRSAATSSFEDSSANAAQGSVIYPTILTDAVSILLSKVCVIWLHVTD